jgi:transposase InsO family protein
VVEQPRSSQRYAPRGVERDRELVRCLLELARQHPRYGYRRMAALLRREGWVVNRKRVQRLWRQEGLGVPVRQRKRRPAGSSENRCVRRRADQDRLLRTMDEVFRQDSSGQLMNDRIKLAMVTNMIYIS